MTTDSSWISGNHNVQSAGLGRLMKLAGHDDVYPLGEFSVLSDTLRPSTVRVGAWGLVLAHRLSDTTSDHGTRPSSKSS